METFRFQKRWDSLTFEIASGLSKRRLQRKALVCLRVLIGAFRCFLFFFLVSNLSDFVPNASLRVLLMDRIVTQIKGE